ncbi:hypothetical protein ACFXPJ_03585 [Streptomyces goshikiensis]
MWRHVDGKSTVGMLLHRPSGDDPDAMWLISPIGLGSVLQQCVPWPAVDEGRFFVAPPRALSVEEECTLARWFRRQLADECGERRRP